MKIIAKGWGNTAKSVKLIAKGSWYSNNGDSIEPSAVVKSLGVKFDSYLTFDNHVQAIVQECNRHLRNLKARASKLSYEFKRQFVHCLPNLLKTWLLQWSPLWTTWLNSEKISKDTKLLCLLSLWYTDYKEVGLSDTISQRSPLSPSETEDRLLNRTDCIQVLQWYRPKVLVRLYQRKESAK